MQTCRKINGAMDDRAPEINPGCTDREKQILQDYVDYQSLIDYIPEPSDEIYAMAVVEIASEYIWDDDESYKAFLGVPVAEDMRTVHPGDIIKDLIGTGMAAPYRMRDWVYILTRLALAGYMVVKPDIDTNADATP